MNNLAAVKMAIERYSKVLLPDWTDIHIWVRAMQREESVEDAITSLVEVIHDEDEDEDYETTYNKLKVKLQPYYDDIIDNIGEDVVDVLEL
jgi:hypothetical protein